MRKRSIGAASLAVGLWMMPHSAIGQPFLPAGPITDSTTSLGQFSIVINPAFVPAITAAFTGNPAYNPATNILTSPLLYDPTTQIDRSTTTTVGSPAYTGGLPVGSPANGTVKASSISLLPTGYTPPAGEDTVFTQIHTFNLSNGGGFTATAGAAAPLQPASVGEVVSNATGAGIGNPSNDFPAKSFFDIFVEVTIPGLGSPMINTTPLIVDNDAITSFPPVVVYTHGNSSAVPLELTAGNALGEPAGTVFGLVTLAGHGAGYSNSDQSATGLVNPDGPTAFESIYNGELSNPSDLMPLPNVIDPTSGTNEQTWSSYVPSVPEPSSLSLLAVGVVAGMMRKRAGKVMA